jgi:Bacterial regulatory proteins, deoR family.
VDGRVITSSFEEYFTKKLALERSPETDLLIDSSKIWGEDFASSVP